MLPSLRTLLVHVCNISQLHILNLLVSPRLARVHITFIRSRLEPGSRGGSIRAMDGFLDRLASSGPELRALHLQLADFRPRSGSLEDLVMIPTIQEFGWRTLDVNPVIGEDTDLEGLTFETRARLALEKSAVEHIRFVFQSPLELLSSSDQEALRGAGPIPHLKTAELHYEVVPLFVQPSADNLSRLTLRLPIQDRDSYDQVHQVFQTLSSCCQSLRHLNLIITPRFPATINGAPPLPVAPLLSISTIEVFKVSDTRNVFRAPTDSLVERIVKVWPRLRGLSWLCAPYGASSRHEAVALPTLASLTLLASCAELRHARIPIDGSAIPERESWTNHQRYTPSTILTVDFVGGPFSRISPAQIAKFLKRVQPRQVSPVTWLNRTEHQLGEARELTNIWDAILAELEV